MLSFICPCIQIYRVADAIPGGESAFLFLLGLCTPLRLCYGPEALRGAVRNHKDISGSLCGDWCASTFCFHLSLTQAGQVKYTIKV